MARIRTIKPEFPQSESMGKVSREARLCFVLLWTLADDAGRLRGNPKMLASLLYPYDDDAADLIESWLADLAVNHCIARYAVGGNSYIQICAWRDHQKIEKPSASRIPPPTPEQSGLFANVLDDSHADQGEDQGVDQGEEGAEASSPPAVSIPLVDKTEYHVSPAQLADWQATYPAVDVLQELREMRTWAMANPAKRKTHRGVASFIVRWLSGEQDKGGKPRGFQQQAPPGRHTDSAEETRRMLDAQSRGEKKGVPPELRGVVAQLTGKKVA
jgi:hypothetical protein